MSPIFYDNEKMAQPIHCYTIRVWRMIPIRSCQLINK